MADDRLVIERFATAPQVTTPMSLAVDDRGRVLVIESHTHQRPKDYVGPPHDRIRLLEDADGDGRAERAATFHEGLKHTLDIATGLDGWIFVATRSEIYRMRDGDGDDRAEQVERIIQFHGGPIDDHDGLSGLAVDFAGNLYFSLGEHAGAAFTLSGTDDARLSGEGEGGSHYHVNADGSGLRRISTGFWNPFGLCRDSFGRLFATDNDPSSRPPNRLLHIVEGGDYGYQYQYGRSGFHPFVAWNGELPGTLGMAAGVGEGACEILSYDSDGLPEDYRGDLLVASWGDHRVERYRLSPKGATFEAERMPFVSGNRDFRAVGLDVAHDGSLFISDWVVGSYAAHHEGRIWRVRWPKAAPQRPQSPDEAVLAVDRRTREAAARALSKTASGRKTLGNVLSTATDAAVRGAALQALVACGERDLPLAAIAGGDDSSGVRLLAAGALAAAGGDLAPLVDDKQHREVAAEALRLLDGAAHRDALLAAMRDDDAWIRRAAVAALSRLGASLASDEWRSLDDPRERLGWLLALRWSAPKGARQMAGDFLQDADPAVRFLALKWISDELLTDFRGAVAAGLDADDLDEELFLAHVAALDRLDNPSAKDWPSPGFVLDKALDDDVSAHTRRMALALVRPDRPGLRLDRIEPLVSHADLGLRREAVRLIAGMADTRRAAVLAAVASDADQPASIRAEAVAGMAADAAPHAELLVALASGSEPALRDEALRSLVGTTLSEAHIASLRALRRRDPTIADSVARVLGEPRAPRPADGDVEAWMAIVDAGGDAEAGRRIFAHDKVGTCVRCHVMSGRGQRVGPDLTLLAAGGDRRRMLQSILEPSREIAPQFVSIVVQTVDGRALTGFAMRKGGEREVYLDATGKEFTLQKSDIESSEASTVSLMPAGLAQALTLQEMRDLFAFVTQHDAP